MSSNGPPGKSLLTDVNNGDYARVGSGAIWQTSVPSSQFYYKPKTVLKMWYLKH